MELILRIAAAALTGAAAALLMKRSSGAMTLPLGAAVCAYALFAVVSALGPLLELMEKAKTLSGLSEAYFFPVMKCVAIGLVTKTAAELCRDGGQGAMAGAVEICGTAAALLSSLPLLRSLLGLLERLL